MGREQWVRFDQWASFWEVEDGYTTGRWVSWTAPVAYTTKTMAGKPANKFAYRHVEEHELDHIKLALVRAQFAEARRT